MSVWPWYTWLLYAGIVAGICVFSWDVLRSWRKSKAAEENHMSRSNNLDETLRALERMHCAAVGELAERLERRTIERVTRCRNFSQEVDEALERTWPGRRETNRTLETAREIVHWRERSRTERNSGLPQIMKRGIGYCSHTECEDYAKGVFLLNHGPDFFCPRCSRKGWTESERMSYTQVSDIFKEVRLEYNFDPLTGKYRELAIVRDEALVGTHNVYTLFSPLIKTEKRALKTAEAILANLSRVEGMEDLRLGRMPRTTEYLLQIDTSREDFDKQLHRLAKTLEGSNLLRYER